MVKLGRGKELHPFSWVIGAEDAEVGFEFLIGWFRLSVGLRVVGGRASYVVVESQKKKKKLLVLVALGLFHVYP